MRPLRGRAVTLKWQQATKNLTLEGADKAAETLNSRLKKKPLSLMLREATVGETPKLFGCPKKVKSPELIETVTG